jgi:hypothetical protein
MFLCFRNSCKRFEWAYCSLFAIEMLKWEANHVTFCVELECATRQERCSSRAAEASLLFD